METLEKIFAMQTKQAFAEIYSRTLPEDIQNNILGVIKVIL